MHQNTSNNTKTFFKYIHLIWFGKLSIDHLQKVKQWKKWNKNLNVILWCSKTHTDTSIVTSNSIHYIEELVDKHSNMNIVQNIISITTSYLQQPWNNQQYAVASDYIRLLVLYLHGGMYFDLDFHPGPIQEHFIHGFFYLRAPTSTAFQPAALGFAMKHHRYLLHSLNIIIHTFDYCFNYIQEHPTEKWGTICTMIALIINIPLQQKQHAVGTNKQNNDLTDDIAIYYDETGKIYRQKNDKKRYLKITVGDSYDDSKWGVKTNINIKYIYQLIGKLKTRVHT